MDLFKLLPLPVLRLRRCPVIGFRPGTGSKERRPSGFPLLHQKIGFVSRSVRKRFRYPILSENSIYRYWIPYAGEEAAE